MKIDVRFPGKTAWISLPPVHYFESRAFSLYVEFTCALDPETRLFLERETGMSKFGACGDKIMFRYDEFRVTR